MLLYIVISALFCIATMGVGMLYYMWRDKSSGATAGRMIAERDFMLRFRWYPDSVLQEIAAQTEVKNQEIYDRMRSFKKRQLMKLRRQRRRTTWGLLFATLLAGFGWLFPVKLLEAPHISVLPLLCLLSGVALFGMMAEWRIAIAHKKAFFKGRYRFEKQSLFVPVKDGQLAEFIDISGVDAIESVMASERDNTVCFVHLLKAKLRIDDKGGVSGR